MDASLPSCLLAAVRTGRGSMTIAVLGIDLAKRVFHLHGVDGHGRTLVSKRVSRVQDQMPPRTGRDALGLIYRCWQVGASPRTGTRRQGRGWQRGHGGCLPAHGDDALPCKQLNHEELRLNTRRLPHHAPRPSRALQAQLRVLHPHITYLEAATVNRRRGAWPDSPKPS